MFVVAFTLRILGFRPLFLSRDSCIIIKNRKHVTLTACTEHLLLRKILYKQNKYHDRTSGHTDDI